MALRHATSGVVMDVRPLGDRLIVEKTCALFKSEDLSVLRVVLGAGQTLHEHKLPGEITIHCIEGSLEVVCGGDVQILNAGEMLYLARHTLHAVKAIQDASALVTISVKH